MRLVRWFARLGRVETAPVSGPHALSAYLALSRLPGIRYSLDSRTSLLASQLSAELSRCRWCIERGQHHWRKAGLSAELLDQLKDSPHSPLFTEREQAALTLVAAIAASQVCASAPDELVMERARRFFGDGELAELTAIVAEHHCLDGLDTYHSGP